MRLRARLLFLIATALLPAFAVLLDFERAARATREAAERAEALRLVRLVSADLESVVEGARQFLAAMANLDEVTAGEATACNRMLMALSRDIARYATFSVADADGRVACSAIPSAIGHDISQRPYFRLAREHGAFAIGDHATSLGTTRHSLHFALPLSAERHGRDGAVVAALDLEWLARRLAEVPLPPGGSVIVADRRGTVLGHWPDHQRFVGQPASPGLLRAITGEQFQVKDVVGLDGLRRIYATGSLGVRPQDLLVGIGIDPAPAEAALAAANRRGLLLIAIGGLGALLLGLFLAYRFMERPVEVLVAAMERWRTGDLTARVAGDPRLGRRGSPSEFTRIAAAFDQAAAAVEAREAALRESEARFHQIAEAIDEVLYIAEPEQRRLLYISPAFRRLFGRPEAVVYARLDTMLDAVHPEDRPALRGLLERPAQSPFDTEYRLLRPDGSERRVRHRRFAVRDSITPRVVGVISDVTEERETAERQNLLAREVDHRAKNVLAVVQSILRLTRADSPRAFAQAVEGRVAALARAHQLLARGRWGGTELAELLREEFAPYTDRMNGNGRAARRCILEGPPLLLRPEAVQPLAMVVHELATNSAKHGALSVPRGVVRIAWELSSRDPGDPPWLKLRWEESGGPPVAGAPSRFGFGSRVVATTVERQLGGSVRFAWEPAGLRCHLAVPAARLLPAGGIEAEEAPERPVSLSGRHIVRAESIAVPVDGGAGG